MFTLEEPGDADDEQDRADDKQNEKEHLPPTHDGPPVFCWVLVLLNLSHFLQGRRPPIQGAEHPRPFLDGGGPLQNAVQSSPASSISIMR